MSARRHIAAGAGLAVVLVALAAGLALHAYHADSRRDLATLEAVRLPDTEGQQRSLDAWQGRVRVVNFWATWCGPCRAEVPILSAAARHLAGRGMVVVGIAVDNAANVAAFRRQTPMDYPVLIAGMDGARLAELAGNAADVIPYTVVLDGNGRVLAQHAGRLDAAGLQHLLATATDAGGG